MLMLMALSVMMVMIERDLEPPGARPGPEATSLLGRDLARPAITDERRTTLEADLAEGKARLGACEGTCEEEWIWYGRRLAYLYRYREAIEVFTTGLERAEAAEVAGNKGRHKLLRHRGHRHITIREFNEAIADLSKAAELIEASGVADEVEPDGAPNAKNIPRSTSHTNIYYHLGLAHYLEGDFEKAVEAYRKCLKYCKNDDMLVATTHWQYMSLRRAGKEEEAAKALGPIKAEMDVIENEAYHRLCLMYQGQIKPEDVSARAEGDAIQDVSAAYGVANWYWCSGERERATTLLEKLAANANWPAFGVIAAEADLARRQKGRE